MKGIYGVLAFIAGGLVGGYISYISTKDYYLKQSDEELKSMGESYEKKYKKIKEENEAIRKELLSAAADANSYKDSLIRLGAEKYQEKRPSVTGKAGDDGKDGGDISDDKEDHPGPSKSYSEGARPSGLDRGQYMGYDPAEVEYPPDDEPEEDGAGHRLKPFKIYEAQWAEEFVGTYDKVTLNFYPEDDILCTEEGELIDNLDSTVGRGWLGDETSFSDDDEFYIRNEATGTDYQIVIRPGLGSDHLSYED